MLQPRIVSVTAVDNLRLRLVYETGEVRLFDAAPYATGPWYGMLLDPNYFARVRVLPGGVGIEWPEGQDIAPHELYQLGADEKPSPASPQAAL